MKVSNKRERKNKKKTRRNILKRGGGNPLWEVVSLSDKEHYPMSPKWWKKYCNGSEDNIYCNLDDRGPLRNLMPREPRSDKWWEKWENKCKTTTVPEEREICDKIQEEHRNVEERQRQEKARKESNRIAQDEMKRKAEEGEDAVVAEQERAEAEKAAADDAEAEKAEQVRAKEIENAWRAEDAAQAKAVVARRKKEAAAEKARENRKKYVTQHRGERLSDEGSAEKRSIQIKNHYVSLVNLEDIPVINEESYLKIQEENEAILNDYTDSAKELLKNKVLQLLKEKLKLDFRVDSDRETMLKYIVIDIYDKIFTKRIDKDDKDLVSIMKLFFKNKASFYLIPFDYNKSIEKKLVEDTYQKYAKKKITEALSPLSGPDLLDHLQNNLTKFEPNYNISVMELHNIIQDILKLEEISDLGLKKSELMKKLLERLNMPLYESSIFPELSKLKSINIHELYYYLIKFDEDENVDQSLLSYQEMQPILDLRNSLAEAAVVEEEGAAVVEEEEVETEAENLNSFNWIINLGRDNKSINYLRVGNIKEAAFSIYAVDKREDIEPKQKKEFFKALDAVGEGMDDSVFKLDKSSAEKLSSCREAGKILWKWDIRLEGKWFWQNNFNISSNILKNACGLLDLNELEIILKALKSKIVGLSRNLGGDDSFWRSYMREEDVARGEKELLELEAKLGEGGLFIEGKVRAKQEQLQRKKQEIEDARRNVVKEIEDARRNVVKEMAEVSPDRDPLPGDSPEQRIDNVFLYIKKYKEKLCDEIALEYNNIMSMVKEKRIRIEDSEAAQKASDRCDDLIASLRPGGETAANEECTLESIPELNFRDKILVQLKLPEEGGGDQLWKKQFLFATVKDTTVHIPINKAWLFPLEKDETWINALDKIKTEVKGMDKNIIEEMFYNIFIHDYEINKKNKQQIIESINERYTQLGNYHTKFLELIKELSATEVGEMLAEVNKFFSDHKLDKKVTEKDIKEIYNNSESSIVEIIKKDPTLKETLENKILKYNEINKKILNDHEMGLEEAAKKNGYDDYVNMIKFKDELDKLCKLINIDYIIIYEKWIHEDILLKDLRPPEDSESKLERPIKGDTLNIFYFYKQLLIYKSMSELPYEKILFTYHGINSIIRKVKHILSVLWSPRPLEFVNDDINLDLNKLNDYTSYIKKTRKYFDLLVKIKIRRTIIMNIKKRMTEGKKGDFWVDEWDRENHAAGLQLVTLEEEEEEEEDEQSRVEEKKELKEIILYPLERRGKLITKDDKGPETIGNGPQDWPAGAFVSVDHEGKEKRGLVIKVQEKGDSDAKIDINAVGAIAGPPPADATEHNGIIQNLDNQVAIILNDSGKTFPVSLYDLKIDHKMKYIIYLRHYLKIIQFIKLPNTRARGKKTKEIQNIIRETIDEYKRYTTSLNYVEYNIRKDLYVGTLDKIKEVPERRELWPTSNERLICIKSNSSSGGDVEDKIWEYNYGKILSVRERKLPRRFSLFAAYGTGAPETEKVTNVEYKQLDNENKNDMLLDKFLDETAKELTEAAREKMIQLSEGVSDAAERARKLLDAKLRAQRLSWGGEPEETAAAAAAAEKIKKEWIQAIIQTATNKENSKTFGKVGKEAELPLFGKSDWRVVSVELNMLTDLLQKVKEEEADLERNHPIYKECNGLTDIIKSMIKEEIDLIQSTTFQTWDQRGEKLKEELNRGKNYSIPLDDIKKEWVKILNIWGNSNISSESRKITWKEAVDERKDEIDSMTGPDVESALRKIVGEDDHIKTIYKLDETLAVAKEIIKNFEKSEKDEPGDLDRVLNEAWDSEVPGGWEQKDQDPTNLPEGWEEDMKKFSKIRGDPVPQEEDSLDSLGEEDEELKQWLRSICFTKKP